MEVWQPQNKENLRLLNNGKYRATVLKGEVVISLTGRILSFQFPFLGVRGDARTFNSIRQRVEHIIGQIKARALFRTPFRGSYRNAVTFATVVGHTVAARINLRGGNYDGYGDWSHFPADPDAMDCSDSCDEPPKKKKTRTD